MYALTVFEYGGAIDLIVKTRRAGAGSLSYHQMSLCRFRIDRFSFNAPPETLTPLFVRPVCAKDWSG